MIRGILQQSQQQMPWLNRLCRGGFLLAPQRNGERRIEIRPRDFAPNGE